MKKYVFEAVNDDLGGTKYVTVTVYALNLSLAIEKAPEVLELEGYRYNLMGVHEMGH